MNADPFDLARFVTAQAGAYGTALAEIRSGRKRSHWIWFVFPQLRGLGTSPTSMAYALSGLAEAGAYLAHPVLGARLREATSAMLAHAPRPADAVLGDLDALKFRSCMTLFAMADRTEPLFDDALGAFFGGERDARTLELLETQGES